MKWDVAKRNGLKGDLLVDLHMIPLLLLMWDSK